MTGDTYADLRHLQGQVVAVPLLEDLADPQGELAPVQLETWGWGVLALPPNDDEADQIETGERR